MFPAPPPLTSIMLFQSGVIWFTFCDYQSSSSLLSAYLSTWEILLVLLLPCAYSSHTSSVWPVCFLILLHSCCPLDFVLLLTTFTMVGIPFTSPLWDLLVLLGLFLNFSGAQHPVFHEKEFMGSTVFEIMPIWKRCLYFHSSRFGWWLEIIFLRIFC